MSTTIRSAADAVAAMGLGADLLREEAADLSSENSRLKRAILSAIHHFERGRPAHAWRDLTDAMEDDGRCSHCGAEARESKPYMIPGVSCAQCGAQSREA